jgi:polyisoprenoid-binding protein YceI
MQKSILIAIIALAALPQAAFGADRPARLDPDHSSATFTVRHLLLTKVSGTIAIKDTTIVFGEGNALKEADATLDLATIDTHQDQRDGDLRSARWFDVATYPLLTFKSTKIEPGAAGAFHITGDLTFHGVTKPVSFDAAYLGTIKDGRGRTHLGYSATFTIDRTAWNLGPTFPPTIVSNDVTIDLEIDAIEG